MILNGNSLILQLGKEDTYGTAATPLSNIDNNNNYVPPVITFQ